MTSSLSLPLLVLTLLAPAADRPVVAPADWPWWRGPSLDGCSRDPSAPLEWSATNNIAWRVEMPGRGHSSPTLWGDRLFVTTADEKNQTQSLLAFDRKTGMSLWATLVHKEPLPRKHPKNSHASATCACDGTRVYCVFVNNAGLHVTATDLDGKIQWQKRVGAFRSEHGYGSSPVLHRGLVIVNGDNLQDCFLAALDQRTGAVAWSAPREGTGRHGGYATPLVGTVAGRSQVVLTGMHETSSYDPLTGKLLWKCAGPSEVTGCTVAFGDRLVFATGGFPEKNLLAIRADGEGDVSKSHVAWRTNRGVTYVPSPLYHRGSLYVVNDSGIASCFDTSTGKERWQERLGGAFSSSPVLVGEHLYVSSEAGKTFVLKAGPKFERVATNDLAEPIFATPAICGGRIYLRTARALYCIGK